PAHHRNLLIIFLQKVILPDSGLHIYYFQNIMLLNLSDFQGGQVATSLFIVMTVFTDIAQGGLR
ncbi:MAG: hypothetical protein KAJ33_00820, partial [Thermoplasmata archaeon]|nr:hypothetical protein [Thermoplasmata archaeon]MCK5396775.1 hypothetical protein [Thermoplasmata archaeon]